MRMRRWLGVSARSKELGRLTLDCRCPRKRLLSNLQDVAAQDRIRATTPIDDAAGFAGDPVA